MVYNDMFFSGGARKKSKKQRKRKIRKTKKASKKKRKQRKMKIILTNPGDVKKLLATFPPVAKNTYQKDPVIHERGSSWGITKDGQQYEIPKEIIDKHLSKIFEKIKENQVQTYLSTRANRYKVMDRLAQLANSSYLETYDHQDQLEFEKLYQQLLQLEEYEDHIYMGLDADEKAKVKQSFNEGRYRLMKELERLNRRIEINRYDEPHDSSTTRSRSQRQSSLSSLSRSSSSSSDDSSSDGRSSRAHRGSQMSEHLSHPSIRNMSSRVERNARPTRGLIPGQEMAHEIQRTRRHPLSGTARNPIGPVGTMTVPIGVDNHDGQSSPYPSVHSSHSSAAHQGQVPQLQATNIQRLRNLSSRDTTFEQRQARPHVQASLPPVLAETLSAAPPPNEDDARLLAQLEEEERQEIAGLDEDINRSLERSQARGDDARFRPDMQDEVAHRRANIGKVEGHGRSNKSKSDNVQAVLFDRNLWTNENALQFLKKHHYHPIKKVHETKNYLRYRLKHPAQGANYITKALPDTKRSIKFIIEV